MTAPTNTARNVEVTGPVAIVGAQGGFLPDLSPDRPDYVTPDGVLVWMERKTIRTRFLNAAGEQVGPWHKNFVPAIVWAAAEGWRDPSAPDWWNDAVISEVRCGGAARQEGQR